MKFDLQLFAEGLSIPGIDDDIAAAIAAELPEEDTEEKDETEEIEATEQVEETEEQDADDATSTAEADSDNKQVEEAAEAQQKTEENDESKRQHVPYARFKEVNDKAKSYEARIKELEEQLKAKQQPSPAANAQLNTEQKPFNGAAEQKAAGNFNSKQMELILDVAMKNAQKKLGLTDDDVANMEFTDDPKKKALYDATLYQEVENVKREVIEYQRQQTELSSMFETTAQEFQSYNNKFNQYADAQERWNYISQNKFNSLSPRKQSVIKAAFTRLQMKKGTYQDMATVSDYFEAANAEYEKSKQSPAAKTTNKVMKKIEAAQALPKAGAVTGGGAATAWTVERVTTLMNDGKWDEIPPDIQQKILRGENL